MVRPLSDVMSLFEPLDAAESAVLAAEADVAPVPPFATVSGFWSVTVLNVGDGKVWAETSAGNISAARTTQRNIFMGISLLGDADHATVVPQLRGNTGIREGQISATESQ